MHGQQNIKYTHMLQREKNVAHEKSVRFLVKISSRILYNTRNDEKKTLL